MFSVIQICNRSLVQIHAGTITSLNDDSEEARFCSILYPQVRDEVLRAHPWNFALDEEELTQDTTAPLTEFRYRYRLPDRCIRVLKINSTARYKIKGRYLHTNESGVIIEFISRVTDTTTFDALFVAALATRLAAVLAYPISGSSDRATALNEEYASLLREAKRRDGQEGIPDDLEANKFVDSRNDSYTDWTQA